MIHMRYDTKVPHLLRREVCYIITSTNKTLWLLYIGLAGSSAILSRSSNTCYAVVGAVTTVGMTTAVLAGSEKGIKESRMYKASVSAIVAASVTAHAITAGQGTYSQYAFVAVPVNCAASLCRLCSQDQAL